MRLTREGVKELRLKQALQREVKYGSENEEGIARDPFSPSSVVSTGVGDAPVSKPIQAAENVLGVPTKHRWPYVWVFEGWLVERLPGYFWHRFPGAGMTPLGLQTLPLNSPISVSPRRIYDERGQETPPGSDGKSGSKSVCSKLGGLHVRPREGLRDAPFCQLVLTLPG